MIACENVGATWLPFEPLRDFQSARPGGVSREAVWLGGSLREILGVGPRASERRETDPSHCAREREELAARVLAGLPDRPDPLGAA